MCLGFVPRFLSPGLGLIMALECRLEPYVLARVMLQW